jgi:acyl carrier protein
MPDILKLVSTALIEASGAKTEDHIIQKLKNGEDANFEDLDMDSLSQFEVIMQIEDALNIELDADEVLAQGTVKTLVDFVEKRSQGASDNAASITS